MKALDPLSIAGARQVMRDDEHLRQSISRIVPPAMLDQLAFCRLEEGTLHLSVTDAVWLTHLRFSAKALLGQIDQDGWRVTAIRGHVLPRRAVVKRRDTARPTPQPSARGARGLRQLAELTDDARLRDSLARLARHVGGEADQC